MKKPVAKSPAKPAESVEDSNPANKAEARLLKLWKGGEHGKVAQEVAKMDSADTDRLCAAIPGLRETINAL